MYSCCFSMLDIQCSYVDLIAVIFIAILLSRIVEYKAAKQRRSSRRESEHVDCSAKDGSSAAKAAGYECPRQQSKISHMRTNHPRRPGAARNFILGDAGNKLELQNITA